MLDLACSKGSAGAERQTCQCIARGQHSVAALAMSLVTCEPATALREATCCHCRQCLKRSVAGASGLASACRFLYGLLGLTVSCYVGALTLIGIMFYWFNPAGAAGGCSFNIVIIVLTLLLCLSFSLLSIHPLVSTGHCGLKHCSCLSHCMAEASHGRQARLPCLSSPQ